MTDYEDDVLRATSERTLDAVRGAALDVIRQDALATGDFPSDMLTLADRISDELQRRRDN